MPDPSAGAAGLGHCANCGTRLLGPHCHLCGQRRADRRLRLADLAREAWAQLLGIDGRLLRTVKELTLRPGDAIRAWVFGRRQWLVAPFRYYLGALLVYLVVMSFTGEPWAVPPQQVPGDDDWNAVMQGYLEFLGEHLKLLSLLMVPVLGVLLHAAFRSQGYDLAESFAFTFYANGHALLGTSLLLPLMTRDPTPESSMAWMGVVIGSTVLYLAWASRRFYGDTPAFTLVKVALVYLAYTVFISAVTLGSAVGAYLLSR